MDTCNKCNNVNLEWNGAWKQCRNCGEVLDLKKAALSIIGKRAQSQWSHVHKNVNDIAALPYKVTLMGKLISRLIG